MFDRNSATSIPSPFASPRHVKLRLLPGEHTKKEVPPFLYTHVMKDIKFLLELVSKKPEAVTSAGEDMPAVNLQIFFLDELVTKCRKFNHEMMPEAKQYFADKQYFDAFGNIHGCHKDIILHAFEVEGSTMRFVDPEAAEVDLPTSFSKLTSSN